MFFIHIYIFIYTACSLTMWYYYMLVVFFYVVYTSLVIRYTVYLIYYICPYSLFNTILSVKSLKCL